MTAELALGTCRCWAIPEAVGRAALSGAQWVDMAPNYATGRAQILLTPVLAAHPSLNVSTKTGYFTAATCADAVNDGVLDPDEAAAGHSLAPDHVRWQTGRNREQLGRDRLDLVLLHNPSAPIPATAPPCTARSGTPSPSWRKRSRLGTEYGVATWAGLEEAFTVGELLALAAEAAGGHHQLAAVQLPAAW
ncbi:hypothetical protein GT039_15915 [Streptomyces sp. SID2955]|nr:hypothetical protein [Streptomyces sp. SID2955]